MSENYTLFHAYDRDGWYIGPVEATNISWTRPELSYAYNALEAAHDMYQGMSVWYVSSAPIKAIRP